MSSSLTCSVLDGSEESERIFIFGLASQDLRAPVFVDNGVLCMQTLKRAVDGRC